MLSSSFLLASFSVISASEGSGFDSGIGFGFSSGLEFVCGAAAGFVWDCSVFLLLVSVVAVVKHCLHSDLQNNQTKYH